MALDLLGDTLRKPDGTTTSADALKSCDVLGLYFSAHWCPPCRGFTPTLATKYTELKKAGKSLEVVFVSSDGDEKAFDSYHGEQPWLALPYAKRDEKDKLSKLFGVSGIPSLVFIDTKTGKTITKDGRGGVSSPTFIEDFPYHPKPLNDLGATTSGINDNPSLIVLMEACPKNEQAALSSMLHEIAEDEMKQDEADRSVQRFFTGKGGGPLPQVRKMCKLESLLTSHEHPLEEKPDANGWGCDGCGSSGAGKTRFRCQRGCDFDFCGACDKAASEPMSAEQKQPCMVILDLAQEGAFYVPEEGKSAVTRENIVSFMSDFGTKKLSRGA